jgi:hypothetical protein
MKLCLESFSKTRNGVIQKEQLPAPSVTVSPLDGSAEGTSARNFQEAVDTAVHQALVNQSGI